MTGVRGAAVAAIAVVSSVACSDESPPDGASVTTDRATVTTTPMTTTVTTATSVDGPATTPPGEPTDDRFPDVIDATATYDDDSMTWSFAVTVSSPYDTPERYADGWRVMAPDGTVLGVHTLLHDHASEQPFTRTQRGVEIPDDVDSVVIEGRDLANGFGGTTATITLERS